MLNFKQYLTEILKNDLISNKDDANYLHHTGVETQTLDHQYDSIHDHPDIAPKNLTEKQKDELFHYSISSPSINNFLSAIEKKHNKTNQLFDNKNDQIESIKKISDSFTPENTNRKKIISYTGIPVRIGRKLLKSEENSKHTLPRFTSTSTDSDMATGYAIGKMKGYKEYHVLKCYNEPGAALSLVKHSAYNLENELLLNHGAHITYHHTTKKDLYPFKKQKIIEYIHHVTVHSTHTPIEQYPGYDKL